MSGWRLDPVGIQVVLDRVGAHAEGLSADLVGPKGRLADDGERILGPLTGASEITELVHRAMREGLEAQMRQVGSVLDRVTAGRLGVLNATLAYQAGQEEMAGV
ncbi:MAG: DUF6507 family protein, partial [Micrococcales bacterium]|nr:DUF6507 family protein [Micrococcales bacterium]